MWYAVLTAVLVEQIIGWGRNRDVGLEVTYELYKFIAVAKKIKKNCSAMVWGQNEAILPRYQSPRFVVCVLLENKQIASIVTVIPVRVA